ncbi:chromosomal replication initiator protein DnaA [Hoeflea sp.]|uniref:chromosomal replication initiator protein DnaA n=1 Tax=Hoeflea sp. TaxID=1940281 RepID=UPI003B51D126
MQAHIQAAGRWGETTNGARPRSGDVCPTTDKGADMSMSNEVFDRVMTRLKAQVGQEVFTSWFGRLKLQSASKSVVRLSVPTAFLKSWINNKYLDQISAIYREEEPGLLKVEIMVRTATRAIHQTGVSNTADQTAAEPTTASPAGSRKESQLTLKGAGAGAKFGSQQRGPQAANAVIGSPLDPQCTFETYVEGSSNRVALAAARTIAEAGTGSVRFNPLFIHSNVGLGKTHLLQAIAAAASTHARNPRVVYLTAEYFMWRFATAIRDNDALSFKESLRNIDLLVIDDMQFLQGKSIQHEFCHLLNMLLDSARQVVVAADRAPWELESLDPRVRSRLQGGVAIEIEAPDYEMRLEMLRRRLAAAQAEDATLDIDENILAHVAQNITSSGRELEGAFNQLLFRRSFEPNLTIERVDQLLGHLVNAGEPKRVRIEDIQRVVSRHYNVTRQELVSDRRTRVIVKPRQIAMYLAKTMTPRSFPEIGRRFGGRDHTTVLHAVRKIEELINSDTKLGHEIELLKRLIVE